MLYNGDNKLMRNLQRNCLYNNYPYNNWINFAKAFFDCRLNHIYIDEYTHYYSIYYNVIKSEIDIRDVINKSNRLTSNKQYRIKISFDIYLEQIIQYENIIHKLSVPALIVHLFYQQHDYIISGNIISSVVNIRELYNLLTKTEIEGFFWTNRPNTKF